MMTSLPMIFAAGIDVDAIEDGLAHHDCAALQDILPGVAFCNFSEFSEMNKMPPEMLKVFRLAQLTIRYLLQSQDMLTEALQKLNTDNDITHQVWQNCPKKSCTQQCSSLDRNWRKCQRRIWRHKHKLELWKRNVDEESKPLNLNR